MSNLIDDIDDLEYTELLLKTDGEPALVQVVNEVKRQRQHKTNLKHPPAYDQVSNGAFENAIDQFTCQFKAINKGLERRIGKIVERNWPVLTWIAEHAAIMLIRYQVGQHGRSTYRRTIGKDCVENVVEFGEQVNVKPKRRSQTNRKQPLDSKWKAGTWAVMISRSDEHIVGHRANQHKDGEIKTNEEEEPGGERNNSLKKNTSPKILRRMTKQQVRIMSRQI